MQQSAAIVIRAGDPRVGQIILIGVGEFSIGRNAGCFLQLPDTSVSRLQCRVSRTAAVEGYEITNESSTSPTLLNGVPLNRPSETLANNDLITCGQVELEFRWPAPDGAGPDNTLKDGKSPIDPTSPLQ